MVLQSEDCGFLHVEGAHNESAAEVGSALLKSGCGAPADADHVWLDIAVLRSHADRARRPGWSEGFDSLLATAESEGRCSPGGDAVRALVKSGKRTWGPHHFRTTMGHYPTGVTVVTAIDSSGHPAGLAVGSFTSVSLNPPLVAFLPAKTSSSFPRIRSAKSFCVNILAHDQADVCTNFARSGGDKFADVKWRGSPSGAPIIERSAGWVDCEWHDVVDAGDHYIALGLVRDLSADPGREPLAFLKSRYGRFAMLDDSDLLSSEAS